MSEELEKFQEGSELEKGTPRQHRNQGVLERGWIRHRLVRELAVGEFTQPELAERYGVSVAGIAEFKARHRDEVEAVRENMADEYADLWVSQKGNRLAAYQEAAEKMADGSSARQQEVLVSVLKAVADEMGDLPQRAQVQVQNNQVRYEVYGVDPNELT